MARLALCSNFCENWIAIWVQNAVRGLCSARFFYSCCMTVQVPLILLRQGVRRVLRDSDQLVVQWWR